MADDELRALLSVDPSPDFTARVRSAVRSDRPRTTWALKATFGLAALLALALSLPSFIERQTHVAGSTTLVSTPLRQANIPLREAIADLRERQPRALVRARKALPSLVEGSKIQLDPRELRALRALFADPPAAYIELPETSDGPIVIPAVKVEPLQLDSLSGGVSQ